MQLQIVHNPLKKAHISVLSKQRVPSSVHFCTRHLLNLKSGGSLVEVYDAKFVSRAFRHLDGHIWETRSKPGVCLAVVLGINDFVEVEIKFLHRRIRQLELMVAQTCDFVRLVAKFGDPCIKLVSPSSQNRLLSLPSLRPTNLRLKCTAPLRKVILKILLTRWCRYLAPSCAPLVPQDPQLGPPERCYIRVENEGPFVFLPQMLGVHRNEAGHRPEVQVAAWLF